MDLMKSHSSLPFGRPATALSVKLWKTGPRVYFFSLPLPIEIRNPNSEDSSPSHFKCTQPRKRACSKVAPPLQRVIRLGCNDILKVDWSSPLSKGISKDGDTSCFTLPRSLRTSTHQLICWQP